jgi:hypothetical protein
VTKPKEKNSVSSRIFIVPCCFCGKPVHVLKKYVQGDKAPERIMCDSCKRFGPYRVGQGGLIFEIPDYERKYNKIRENIKKAVKTYTREEALAMLESGEVSHISTVRTAGTMAAPNIIVS